jgi:cell division protein FtsB
MPQIKMKKNQWIFFILIIILVSMLMGLNARLAEYFRLTQQRNEMQFRLDNLEATEITIQTQIAFAKSEKAVEEWARTYERQALPDDYVIIPLPPKNVSTEINYLPTATPQTTENWQIWWDWFFNE